MLSVKDLRAKIEKAFAHLLQHGLLQKASDKATGARHTQRAAKRAATKKVTGKGGLTVRKRTVDDIRGEEAAAVKAAVPCSLACIWQRGWSCLPSGCSGLRLGGQTAAARHRAPVLHLSSANIWPGLPKRTVARRLHSCAPAPISEKTRTCGHEAIAA